MAAIDRESLVDTTNVQFVLQTSPVYRLRAHAMHQSEHANLHCVYS